MKQKLYSRLTLVFVMSVFFTFITFAQTSIQVRIASGDDDVEENITAGSADLGKMDITSSDLELGEDGGDLQAVGLRYLLRIGQGDTIKSAWLQFSTDETKDQGDLTLQIWAEAADDAAAFTEDSANVTSRVKTDSVVEWTPFDWNTSHEISDTQKTVDISGLIQEVVDRDGWEEGNAIVFIILPKDADNDSVTRCAGAFEDSSDPAPVLNVSFASGPRSIAIPIATGEDDVEENITAGSADLGKMDVTSSDLELGEDGGDIQAVGLRYILPVMKGAPISDAWLQFSTDETKDQGDLTLQIWAEAADDAAAFTEDSANVSSRVKTDSVVEWAPLDWNTTHEISDTQKTVNISGLIQEVIDRDGWEEGNAIVFIIVPKDADNDSVTRCAGAFEDSSDPAPVLHLTYAPVPVTTEALITVSEDDVEENIDTASADLGDLYMDSSDLELGSDGGDLQAIGLRYTLPAGNGATISEAWIQFSADQPSDGALTLQIWAEASDDAPAFEEDSANVTSRERTETMVEWTPPDWHTKHEVSDTQKTVDISALIQEVVSRPGWNKGNHIVFILIPTADVDTSWREAGAWDDSDDPAPVLHLSYAGGLSRVLATDAHLASLSLSVGDLVPAFNPDSVNYTVELPPGTKSVTVTASANSWYAMVADAETVVDVSSLSGMATVVVTAEDGASVMTYKVTMTVSTVGVQEHPVSSNILVYHNSLTSQLRLFNASEVEMIDIYNIAGMLLNRVKTYNQETFDISTANLPNGVYLVRMKLSENRVQTAKFVK